MLYDIELEIVESGFGNAVKDPLDRVHHNDESATECPEDQTCNRDMNDWIMEVTNLRLALAEVAPSHALLQP